MRVAAAQIEKLGLTRVQNTAADSVSTAANSTMARPCARQRAVVSKSIAMIRVGFVATLDASTAAAAIASIAAGAERRRFLETVALPEEIGTPAGDL